MAQFKRLFIAILMYLPLLPLSFFLIDTKFLFYLPCLIALLTVVLCIPISFASSLTFVFVKIQKSYIIVLYHLYHLSFLLYIFFYPNSLYRICVIGWYTFFVLVSAKDWLDHDSMSLK